MSTLLWVVLIGCLGLLGFSAASLLMWRRVDTESQQLAKRVSRLALKKKLRLAFAMARDRRIPLAVRAIPPGLVLYLAMPLDIVPDFIPVLGQLDDVIVVVVGVGLLLRFTPRSVLEEHLGLLEGLSLG